MDLSAALIATPRFIVRPISINDASNSYLNWFNDPMVKSQISTANKITNLEDLKSYIAGRINCEDVFFCGIFDKNTMLHIGNIKFEPIDLVNRFAVVGILIGEVSYRGVGCAAEVLRSCNHWLCLKLNLTHIILTVNRNHLQAIRAYKSAGFKMEIPPGFIPAGEVLTFVKWFKE